MQNELQRLVSDLRSLTNEVRRHRETVNGEQQQEGTKQAEVPSDEGVVSKTARHSKGLKPAKESEGGKRRGGEIGDAGGTGSEDTEMPQEKGILAHKHKRKRGETKHVTFSETLTYDS